MSIITVLATKKYVSIMADGRVTGDDGSINTEDYPKLLSLSANTFIAFTGRVEYFEALLSACNFDASRDYHDIASHAYNKFLEMQFDTKNLIIVIGGKCLNNEIGYIYFSNIGHQFTHVKPEKDDEINHLLLLKSEYGAKALLDGLLNSIGFDTIDKAFFIQHNIHDFQASLDNTINSRKYSMRILV